MKRCSGCGKVQPWTAFSAANARKDGRQNYCKDCARAANRKSHLSREIVPQDERLRRRAKWAAIAAAAALGEVL